MSTTSPDKGSLYSAMDRRATRPTAAALDARLRAAHGIATPEGMVGDAEVEEAISVLGLTPGSVLLDLGCGSAQPSRRIVAATGCRCVAVDVAHERLTKVPRDAGFVALLADLDQCLPVAPSTADGAVQFDSVVHVDDKVAHLRRVHDALRPGSALVLTSSTNSPLTDDEARGLGDVPGTIFRLHADQLVSALSIAGFEVQSVRSRRDTVLAWHTARAAAWDEQRDALLAEMTPDEYEHGRRRSVTVSALLERGVLDMTAVVARRS